MEWTHEKDLLLAEQVIRATREGVSHETVWKTFADKWGCAASLCEEHWKKDLEKHYVTALEIAGKAYQITRMMHVEKEEVVATPPKSQTVKATKKKIKARNKKKKATKPLFDIDDMIAELRKIKKQRQEWEQVDDWKKERVQLEKEVARLIEEKTVMKQHIETLEQQFEDMKMDYGELMRIVSRATHMTDVG